jgi:hypothetical protein
LCRTQNDAVRYNALPHELPASRQIEINQQFDAIFHPFAKTQRDALYAQNPSARFVHYTSAESALKIVTSKRLWMRNTTCMTDYREVQHGYGILARYFADAQKRSTFVQSLDQCAPGVANEAMNLFDQWRFDIGANTYIASVSEHGDQEDNHGRLSMWRAFGDAKGCARRHRHQGPFLFGSAIRPQGDF